MRNCVNTQVRSCASAQVFAQVHKYASAQVDKCANTELRKCASTQLHKCASNCSTAGQNYSATQKAIGSITSSKYLVQSEPIIKN